MFFLFIFKLIKKMLKKSIKSKKTDFLYFTMDYKIHHLDPLICQLQKALLGIRYM